MNRHLSAWVKLLLIQKRHSTAGLTLLEVLIVIIVIGILAATTAPGWLTFANRQRANNAQDQILQALKDTQAEARRIRQDRTLTLVVNDGGLPQLDFDSPNLADDPADPTSLPPVTIGNENLNPGGLSLSIIENGTPFEEDAFRIRFDANGGIDVDEQPLDLPVTISVASPAGSDTQRCVILQTILASTRIGRDDECNVADG
ncbi:MAG: prepilin-type N-terminal cleavage/methylation domain-containing protein [Cyanobacteria bacterium J06626_14]